MQLRPLVICAIVAFTAGLVVASFAGFREFLPGLLEGALVTIEITIGGCVLAVIMAFVAALAKMYGPRPVRWLAVAYIEIFRGTSALVQLFWLFFVLPHFGVTARAADRRGPDARPERRRLRRGSRARRDRLGASRPVGGDDRAQHDAARRRCAASSCRRRSSR